MFCHSSCHSEQVTNVLHICKALGFGEEILQEKWSVLCVVLAAAIHSKRLWDLHWSRDPPHPPEETGQAQILLICAFHLRDCHKQRFFLSHKKELCRADQEGPTIPRLLRYLKIFTSFPDKSCHSCWQYKALWLRWVTAEMSHCFSTSVTSSLLPQQGFIWGGDSWGHHLVWVLGTKLENGLE